MFILSIQSISVEPIGLTTRQCRPLSPHGSFGRLSTIQSELRVKNSILILTMEFPARKYTAQLNCRRPNNSPKEIQHFHPTQPGPALILFPAKLYFLRSNVKPLVMRLLLRSSNLSLFFSNI